MKELWEELKEELEAADGQELREMAGIIRSQLDEMEQDGMSYAEFLEKQESIDFGSDK